MPIIEASAWLGNDSFSLRERVEALRASLPGEGCQQIGKPGHRAEFWRSYRLFEGQPAGEGFTTALLLSFTGGPDGDVEQRLLALPGAPTVEYTQDVEDYINELNELFFVFVGIMLAFGVALGFAVIFNTITINTLERRRELATMRTIGSAVGRLGAMLTVENVLMGVLGVVVGLPLGYVISLYFASLYQNELFDMPTVIYTRTYGIAALGALLVLLLAEVPSIRFLRRLDLAAVVREMSA